MSPIKQSPTKSGASPKKKGGATKKVVSKKKIWKRLSEVFPSNSIVKISDAMRKDKKLLFEDIEQGDLGDCYFLCVLCAMCEFPDKIIDLFPSNTGVIKNGVIEVLLFIHGIPTKICIDDYLPFITFEDDDPDTPDPTFPCFAKVSSISGNLWPSILEKVWAKLNITYSGIAKGSCGEAFEVLFPAPVVSFDHQIHSADLIWEKTMKADEDNYLICADISEEGRSQTFLTLLTKMGLISNHAYTVISVR